MDITAIVDTREEGVMASSSNLDNAKRQTNDAKKKRRGISKRRPVSTTTLSRLSSEKPATRERLSSVDYLPGFRNSIASAFGEGFPFAKPRAFFSIEQQLPERVDVYNQNHDAIYHLRPHSASEEEVYSGLLRFHYSDGIENFTENVHVTSSSTVSELLPELITRFLPHEYQLDAVDGTQPSSVALLQGQMERELDSDEKPLDIALDCSTKGMASPKFLFKSVLPDNSMPLTPRRTNMNLVGPDYPILDYGLHLSQPDHHNSIGSFGSVLSIASSKSAKSKSTSSLVGLKASKKKVQHTMSNQEIGGSPSSSPSHSRLHLSTQQEAPTPSSGRKMTLSKSAVSNFITRSLRVKKKPKQSRTTSMDESSPGSLVQDSNEEKEEDEDDDDCQLTNSLISPRIPVERKFTLSTVMHIYFTEGKQAQVYKSVLVSERASTLEVIAQALERYNMKFRDPRDYSLYDVVGKWQDVTNTLTHQSSGNNWNGNTSTLPNLNILNASPLIQRHTSIEEFVVCYKRELGPDESPYKMQFYLTTQEGFTRRFELRSKEGSEAINRVVSHEKSHSVDIMERPDELTPTPADMDNRSKHSIHEGNEIGIFGKTSHRKRARRNRIFHPSFDSADPEADITILEHTPTVLSPTSPLIETEKFGRIHAKVNIVRESRGNEDEDQDMEIPISMNASHPPNFTALMCSSPDSGVEFQKAAHQTSSTKSSVSSEQSESHTSAGGDICSSSNMYSANLDSPFLLTLRLCDPIKEPLVHKLASKCTELGSLCLLDQPIPPSTERVFLHHSGFAQMEGPLCSICQQLIEDPLELKLIGSKYKYTLKRLDPRFTISLNGQELTETALIKHGDIISMGNFYIFMFQDYTSLHGGHIPEYSWQPLPRPVLHSRSQPVLHSRSQPKPVLRSRSKSRESRKSNDTVTKSISRMRGENSPSSLDCDGQLEDKHSHGQPGQESKYEISYQENSTATMRLERVNCLIVDLQQPQRAHVSNSIGSESTETAKKVDASNKKKTKSRQAVGRTQSLPLPKDRKLIFSFRASEEDDLLTSVITSEVPGHSQCKLAPAYILAMCTEYCIMSSGPESALRFIQKAADHIQEVVWEFIRRVTAWKPDPEKSQNPLHSMKELFPLLQPVFYWIANCLEFYNFLITHNSFLLEQTTPINPSQSNREEMDNPISTFYDILVYTYQQAFYPVSKVLYQSLPRMLESCIERATVDGREDRPLVIGGAVEFLQTLLDLLTDQHLHFQVISQFFANIFFFVNAAMFNALLDQGSDLGLYQYYSGRILRENLDLLEGWGCQVGFKDSVLHYLAKFSVAIDLLATPTDRLLKLSWSDLCWEFPVLHPAQLHYLLSQYLLPSYIMEVPLHWTPSKEDAIHALNARSLHESFDHHPGFHLPASGYALDLNYPPPNSDHFQDILEKLRKNLRRVTLKETRKPTKIQLNTPSKFDVPSLRRKTDEYTDVSESTVLNMYTSKSRGGIGSYTESQEDLLAESSQENQKNLKKNFIYKKSHSVNESRVIMDSFPYQNGLVEVPNRERTGRVGSVVGVRSFATPEKLILEAESPDARVYPSRRITEVPPSSANWTGMFPHGSRTVTIPRGDKGFGFIMVENKDPRSNESMIVIQQVLPGSTAAECEQLKPGDRILAIDEQLLDGADYLIAEKYVKEAEDDVTLTLATTSDLHL